MGVSWGLLSTARINDAILRAAPDRIVAVGSRSEERAQAYAREHAIPRAHGSYEALLADAEVDAVYISLPNGLHTEWAIRAAEAGKHVLVEKPFSRRVADVERAFDAAERAGVVMSEAFMWRHNPQTARLVELLPEIGEVRLVRAAFSFPLDRPGDVRWDPALDGGALMDVGCYCISAARLICGEPLHVVGFAAGEQVDSRFAGTMFFDGGVLATFDCGFDMPARSSLEVIGSTGSLSVADPWHAWNPGIELDGKRVEVPKADSYLLELDDMEAAIETGRPPLLGRADALGQARVLEALLDPEVVAA